MTQSSGSAYIETQRTKIACAVQVFSFRSPCQVTHHSYPLDRYGPRQAPKSAAYSELGKINVDVKFTPFSCARRRVPNKDSEDRSLSLLIQQALLPSIRLELFPKSIIDVYITVLQNDGTEGCVAAGTVAASAALADAGVEMVGLVVSCAAAVVGKEIWLDPTTEESKRAEGTVIVSCMPALGSVTNTRQTGQLTVEQTMTVRSPFFLTSKKGLNTSTSQQCIDRAVNRCTDIHLIVAQALREGTQAQQLPSSTP